MNFLVAHLSDIHIVDVQDGIFRKVDGIARTMFTHLGKVDAVFVVVSGDIANEGFVTQYGAASILFKRLKAKLATQTRAQIHLLFAPGNHDCDFSGNQALRKTLLAGLLASSEAECDKSVIDTCTSIQSNFFDFSNELTTEKARRVSDRLYESYEFNLGKHRVIFDCFNVSWTSQRREVAGKILFPFGRYERQLLEDSSLRIAVFHHPFNWYAPGENREFFEFVKRYSNIVLTGHEHQLSANRVIDVNRVDRDTVFVEGGVLQDREGRHASSFNVIVIDLEQSSHQVLPYRWNPAVGESGEYVTEVKDNAFAPLKTNQRKTHREFRITDEFASDLSDAGAVFNHPKKEDPVSIDDVFVYPEVKFLDRDDDEVERVSASAFETLADDETYVLIKGEEKSGKTTLAYQLFRSFHSVGLIPVYLDATEVGQPGALELRKALSRTIVREYGEGADKRFLASDISKRVLLLDNFELSPITERYRHKLLEFMHKEFRHIFLFSNDVVQLDELFLPNATELLKLYRSAQVLRYGHKLRYELINRWNSIGDSDPLAGGDVLARNDHAQKMVNGILGKNFIPSLPLYLLTILQSIEAGKPSEIQQTGWGHYYQFLIVQALTRVKVREQALGELFNYLAELAYRYFAAARKEFSEQELREFNRWFSGEFTEVDFGERIGMLVSSKILHRHGTSYSFKYPYIYYYFAAQYLAAHIQEEPIRERVRNLCSRVYVLEFANIIIFLTHHTRDPIVIVELMALAKCLFGDEKVMSFEEDIQEINKTVTEVPKLVFRGGDPAEHRRKVLEYRDQIVEPADPLENAGPDTELRALSIVAQINLAFKTAEILGQIVKNNYGSLKKQTKVDVLGEIYDTPLRALTRLFNEVASDPAELMGWVEHWLKEEKPHATDEQRHELARRWFFAILAAIGVNFVKKISEAAGSEHLREEYEQLLKRKGILSYKLVDLSTKLDVPKAIPFSEIAKLAHDVKGNALAFRLVQALVLRHLHMFKTTDIDKQKLCSGVELLVATQRGVDVATQSTKLLTDK